MSAVADVKPERLFVGVPIPERTREILARQLPVPIPGKASPSVNWHFTLRFLGSTEAILRDRLIAELSRSQFGKRFEIAFDSLGAFPNARRAKILWAGIGRGRERLESVAQLVERASVSAGFPAEERRFSAHLTLSRINPPRPLGSLIESAGRIEARMRVEEVVLYRSELGGPHSKYTPIETFTLG